MMSDWLLYSEQQQTVDLPMTTAYASIDPSSSPDAAYARIQKPEQDYENDDVLHEYVPRSNYLIN